MRRIVKLFEKGNVMVFGLKGTGKDTLFGNVIMRRKLPYVSSTNYGGQFIPYRYSDFDCGGNTYKNFVSGDVKAYDFSHPDKTDLYLPDVGVFYPSQYSNALDRDYPQIPVYLALSRHVANGSVHTNCQAFSRPWNKLREQSEIFINCRWCKWLFGCIVIQRVRIYERASAAEALVPPFPLRRPLFGFDRLFQWKLAKTNYLIAHGKIRSMTLIYFNKSQHDTRHFKEVMRNGKKV